MAQDYYPVQCECCVWPGEHELCFQKDESLFKEKLDEFVTDLLLRASPALKYCIFKTIQEHNNEEEEMDIQEKKELRKRQYDELMAGYDPGPNKKLKSK